MIEIEGVSHSLSGVPILRDIDLTIPKGGVTALIGPNGAGKSTLLSLMARLERVQTGRIRFDGLDVTQTPTGQLARVLAILRQETRIATRLTLRDLVSFGRYPHHKGRPGAADRAAVDEAIATFGLEPLAGRQIDTLSGGQRQRAFVAMTFAQGTDYLLLDEPLNNLDMSHARALMLRLGEVARTHGRTVVIVVHEINYAAAHADRIVAMKDGRVVRNGPPGDTLTGAALTDLFDTPIDVTEIHGRPVSLHYA
ncbi:ATP-binding cassette domain-containing protein [Mesobaculum littorinae]|uniref:ATP-binding cassette domain-containing protein n=1 Tax=Mesobaculum littorinae TaxID=2486419 RepID=A0A438AIP5_9RHOB|nr:ATP-binding cassette domain-containing protein [Mesobaculum littorinae]RVV98569.1 ATP-binding cassette domain-containing protein [Mesobaculum littorinae]